LKPGEILTAAYFEAFSKLYSPQAIEIFGNQLSNIGTANLRAPWDNYTGAKMETNSLGLIGIEGVGPKAVAWGKAGLLSERFTGITKIAVSLGNDPDERKR
jgi:hypothetical protein